MRILAAGPAMGVGCVTYDEHYGGSCRGDSYPRERMTAVEEVVQIPFFQGIPAEALREIAVQSTILSLEAGRTFISQHAAAEHVFFLISGSVQFYIHFHGVDDLLVGTMRQPGALL